MIETTERYLLTQLQRRIWEHLLRHPEGLTLRQVAEDLDLVVEQVTTTGSKHMLAQGLLSSLAAIGQARWSLDEGHNRNVWYGVSYEVAEG